MHCPSCGQQQISEETKFCSRCGFPLALVGELLMHGGFLPQLAEFYKRKSIFNKKNGVMFSLFWFIFFLLIMAPLWGIADVDELAGASAIIGIFGGLLMLIASLVFLKSSKTIDFPMSELPRANPQHLYGAQPAALPPQQSQPVSSYAPPGPGRWKAADTGDLQPRSVTEGTTKLLQKDENNQ